MSTSRKKPLLFAVIVVVGTVLVLLDVPLILLVPLLVLVGFITLLALGSLTLAEIRAALPGQKPARPGPDGTGRPERTVPGKGDTKKATPPGTETKGVAKPAGNGNGAPPAPATHLSTLVSAVRSLGFRLRDPGSREKKVEDIDRLLDQTVSERVTAPPRTGTVKADGGATPTGDPVPGDGPGAGLPEGTAREDGAVAPPSAPGAPAPDAGSIPAGAAGGPALPPAPGRTTGEISEDGGGDPGLFSGPDGRDRSGAGAGDADTRSPGGAGRGGTQAIPDTMAEPAAGGGTDRTAMKTIRVPPGTPDVAGGSGDDAPAATAATARGDEALFRTIASDGKEVRKEQDTSLLRDLKDFRAPAAEIERELEDLSGQLGMAQQKPKKNPPATREKK
jgi:hypothetical protein